MIRHHPRGRVARPLAAVAGLIAGAAVLAAGFLPLELDRRLAAAHDAAVGVVVAVDAEVRDGEAWTRVTLEVERWWRRAGERVPDGAGAGDALEAWFWGGRPPGVAPLVVVGVPTFTPGERVLGLLRRQDGGLGAPTVGVTQGVWRPVGGGWVGDDGSRLGVDDDGALALDGAPVSDDELFAALDAAFEAVGEAP